MNEMLEFEWQALLNRLDLARPKLDHGHKLTDADALAATHELAAISADMQAYIKRKKKPV